MFRLPTRRTPSCTDNRFATWVIQCLLTLLFLSQVSAGDPTATDVFVPKDDGFKSIRIPSLLVSKAGTLLAFAEGRAANADQAKNKLILKRSTDGGKTWGKLKVIADSGEQSLNNPTAVVERGSGQILLMYQSYPAAAGELSEKLQPGHDGEFIVRNWLLTSDDDGVTWNKPRDITQSTKRETVVTTLASGPGIGLQLRHGKHAGRLLFPLNEGPYGVWNIYVVYSDDLGKTWRMGDIAPGGIRNADTKPASIVNEAQVVELSDGQVRFNVRRWGDPALRKTSISKDGGQSWSQIEDVPELADPSCMASILRYTDPADGKKSRILYSGPNSKKRDTGTVHLSYDEGQTWPVSRVLCQDAFAYSCLAALPDGTMCCLYEADNYGKIVLARFTLDWLTKGQDHLESK